MPQRSLRAKRKVFVICSVAFVTGFLLLGIWKPYRNEFLAPGGLSSHHAQIWSGPNAENRCIACHSNGAVNPLGWVASFFGNGSHVRQPQYRNCLTCHEKTIDPERALLVHNLPQEDLARMTARIAGQGDRQTSLLSNLLATPARNSDDLACSTCHQEHHGKDHDLAAMTDQQCQTCHANQFKSFEHGHPEFKSFSQTLPTGIQFDHYAHQAKYFAEANRQFDCQTCHGGDKTGQFMKLLPYETSCASCHDKSIDASLTQGLPVFRLPSIDVEQLRLNGLEIGSWPEAASGSFDGSLPPVMKVLLASDPRAVEAFNVLGPEFDLFDVDPDDQAQLVAISKLTLSIKQLMLDLSRKGQAGLTARLEILKSQSVARAELKQIVAGLSAETFTLAQQAWFPNLQDEVDNWQPAQPLESGKPAAPASAARTERGGVVQASYQDIADEGTRAQDELLIENPLKKYYPPAGSVNPPVKDLPAVDDSELDGTRKQAANDNMPNRFQSLPQQESRRPPATNFFDRIEKELEPDQVRVNPHSSQTRSRSADKPGFDTRQKNAVGNRFYRPRTSNPNEELIVQDRSDSPRSQAEQLQSEQIQSEQIQTEQLQTEPSRSGSADNELLAPNPLGSLFKAADESSDSSSIESSNRLNPNTASSNVDRPVQGSSKIESSLISPDVNSTEKIDQESEAKPDPIVIRDESLPSSQPQELLVENPLKELLDKSLIAKDSAVGKGTSPNSTGKEYSTEKGQAYSESGLAGGSGSDKSERVPEDPDQKIAGGSERGKTKPQVADRNAAIELPLLPADPTENQDDRKHKQALRSVQKNEIKPDPDLLPPQLRVPLGGWYRDDETLTIAYRQTGHGDKLTRQWYDFTGSIQDARLGSALADFKQQITNPLSPGQCASCHQTKELASGNGLRIQWKATYGDPNASGLTRFSHRPHLIQSGNQQCQSCHEIDPAASKLNLTEQVSTEANCRSGFHPIRKNNCTTCHNSRSQLQSCTQCHNYHAGRKHLFQNYQGDSH